jgi:PqqD family protein of HPr-rel-A system
MQNAKGHLTHLALSESGFLFDPTSGHTYSLNSTAKALLRALIDGTEGDQLVALLVERFDTDHDTAARGAEHFLERLRTIGLLEASPSEGVTP